MNTIRHLLSENLPVVIIGLLFFSALCLALVGNMIVETIWPKARRGEVQRKPEEPPATLRVSDQTPPSVEAMCAWVAGARKIDELLAAKRAADELIAAYAEQNQGFGRMVEKRGVENARLLGLLESLLRAGARLVLRTRPAVMPANEACEWTIYDGMSAAVRADLAKLSSETKRGLNDTQILDWVAAHWESQQSGPQTLILPTMDNVTGSFRDAVEAHRATKEGA